MGGSKEQEQLKPLLSSVNATNSSVSCEEALECSEERPQAKRAKVSPDGPKDVDSAMELLPQSEKQDFMEGATHTE